MSTIDYNYTVTAEGGFRLVGRWQVEGQPCREVFFEGDSLAAGLPAVTVRPLIFAFLLPAMRLGLPLELPEDLDEVTLPNLYEWQAACASALPKLQVIELRLGREKKVLGARPGSLCAFSGGVDSCYSAFRGHVAESLPRLHVTAGLMVHGLDIPLREKEHFGEAWQRSRELM
ncbi:hypothetical protein [Roseibacillus ishigakijimensis]|uniref:Uncharacterized protein n=1 Tax=Roseibacillus ishigakijimensis TaxID=454146 RepID=A0A934RKS1_9BACT|nr:hypothetical protein [Roseibacillus ishigakijimensis]MBK1833527.1 hypothetical protein [Roseibacillus ishigakijimensis]